MPMCDSDIPMNVPFTFRNKQPFPLGVRQSGVCVYYSSTYYIYKAVRAGGGRGIGEDKCYESQQAKACVD